MARRKAQDGRKKTGSKLTEAGYIDLSKRRVSPEDIVKCEERYNKGKLVHSIMRHVAEKTNTPIESLYESIAWPLNKKFGHAIDAFKLSITFVYFTLKPVRTSYLSHRTETLRSGMTSLSLPLRSRTSLSFTSASVSLPSPPSFVPISRSPASVTRVSTPSRPPCALPRLPTPRRPRSRLSSFLLRSTSLLAHASTRTSVLPVSRRPLLISARASRGLVATSASRWSPRLLPRAMTLSCRRSWRSASVRTLRSAVTRVSATATTTSLRRSENFLHVGIKACADAVAGQRPGVWCTGWRPSHELYDDLFTKHNAL